jgi:integrase
MRNYSASLNQFADILKDYTADDLLLDQMYGEFLQRFEHHLPKSSLRPSTMRSYVGMLTGKILLHADVRPSIVVEFKAHLRQIHKALKLPKPVNDSISDDDVVSWIGKMDHYCENPDNAPNLNVIAYLNSKIKKPQRTSLRLLLALRCYVWLCLITAGRADEVRRIRVVEVNEGWVSRELLKAKLYTESAISDMPGWAWQRIEPYLAYVRENRPGAVFLFSETENSMGKGTISAGVLRELVKGSMIDAGLGPTSPSKCYYRVHDLRKTIARWIDYNGGSISEVSACLAHSSPDVTYKHYFADDLKQALAASGRAKAMDRLGSLLDVKAASELGFEELQRLFRGCDHIEVFRDGGIAMPEGMAYGGPGFIEEVRAPGLEPGTS